jgi:iron only hydrogenase large subunit-like protein/uncharacterized Fe-S cluster-containing protein
MSEWVISTNRARCRDCYRCVRTCPVKAVKVRNGQAQIVAELCTACGSCVLACPQEAKVERDDRPLIREALAQGRTVVASVAPSAPAFFRMTRFSQMAEALRSLGFAAAGETAFGAEMVGIAHRELVDADPGRWPVITSSCPVVVNLIEKYYPDLIPHLAPIVSPMLAHGRWLRKAYGDDAFIVFIGPCIAKKEEIHRNGASGTIDAALNFRELREWLQDEGQPFPEEEPTDEAVPRAAARLFPIEGGLVGTANMDTDILTSHIVTTSGLEACEDVLRGIRAGALSACMVELMACEGGCINGPAMAGLGTVFAARQRVIEYATRRQAEPLPSRDEWPDLSCTYMDRSVSLPEFSEDEITEMLHRVDKFTPQDELNCGACGYPTCREKAVATLRGMAEPTMCIPYMRRRAESLRQVVMEVTPNAVIVVDTRLYVQDMSPSAEKMLNVHLQEAQGRPLETFMPAIEGFARVRNGGLPVLNEVVRLRPDLVIDQTIVPVEGQNLLVAILRDITEHERQQEQIERIRRETLAHSQAVVKNQMRVAHEIAQLLGETTAEARMALLQLGELLEKAAGQ